MIRGTMDRIKSRIGIYGTGWNHESVMGLLLPIFVVGVMGAVGFLLVKALHAV